MEIKVPIKLQFIFQITWNLSKYSAWSKRYPEMAERNTFTRSSFKIMISLITFLTTDDITSPKIMWRTGPWWITPHFSSKRNTVYCKIEKMSVLISWVEYKIPPKHAQKLHFFANFLDFIHYFIAHFTNLLFIQIYTVIQWLRKDLEQSRFKNTIKLEKLHLTPTAYFEYV